MPNCSRSKPPAGTQTRPQRSLWPHQCTPSAALQSSNGSPPSSDPTSRTSNNRSNYPKPHAGNSGQVGAPTCAVTPSEASPPAPDGDTPSEDLPCSCSTLRLQAPYRHLLLLLLQTQNRPFPFGASWASSCLSLCLLLPTYPLSRSLSLPSHLAQSQGLSPQPPGAWMPVSSSSFSVLLSGRLAGLSLPILPPSPLHSPPCPLRLKTKKRQQMKNRGLLLLW
mmetsp:Transcript_18076/g.36676  ORF Transcript_18076/g.36676 Transcript_18076/m.36676 type:complete len:222 (+) Transcript_18076:1199-1864(+)